MSLHQVPKYLGIQMEQPAAAAGTCLLTPNQTMIRPIIGGRRKKQKRRTLKRKQRKTRKQSGGFLPSIGEPFVAAVSKYIAPLALYGIYRFINGSKKTRKARK
jgi:hypothetical protein